MIPQKAVVIECYIANCPDIGSTGDKTSWPPDLIKPSSPNPDQNRIPISVARLRNTLGISRERMGRLLAVSARTIQRWEDNDQLPSNRWVTNVLIDVHRIVELGQEVFTPEGLHVVMTQPQPVFGEKSGLDKIEAGEGEDVYSEFAGAYDGYIGT